MRDATFIHRNDGQLFSGFPTFHRLMRIRCVKYLCLCLSVNIWWASEDRWRCVHRCYITVCAFHAMSSLCERNADWTENQSVFIKSKIQIENVANHKFVHKQQQRWLSLNILGCLSVSSRSCFTCPCDRIWFNRFEKERVLINSISRFIVSAVRAVKFSFRVDRATRCECASTCERIKCSSYMQQQKHVQIFSWSTCSFFSCVCSWFDFRTRCRIRCA